MSRINDKVLAGQGAVPVVVYSAAGKKVYK
jgi:hypothetical protein